MLRRLREGLSAVGSQIFLLTRRGKGRQGDNDFGALMKHLQTWQIPDAAIDSVHDSARASLAEVKALTEYEDGKVSRLLTIAAFLSAVVAAVFSRFASDYAWPGVEAAEMTTDWLLPTAAYAAFFIYVMLVTYAVLVVLTAIRPTFNVPATWSGDRSGGLPTSMLFYKGILDVSALQRGKAFQQLTGADGKELKRYYAKCYTAEAYLVAGKVARKLKIVSPGIATLRSAMVVLLVFFALFGATILWVDPTRI